MRPGERPASCPTSWCGKAHQHRRVGDERYREPPTDSLPHAGKRHGIPPPASAVRAIRFVSAAESGGYSPADSVSIWA